MAGTKKSRKELVNELHDAGLISTADASTLAGGAGTLIVNVTPGAAVADVTGTADGTYDATEQGIINDSVTAINAIIARLEGLGLIST